MSRIPNVPTQVPTIVPAAGAPARRARYLVGGPAGWRFQMRLPVWLSAVDSFLTKPSTILRVRIGPLSRREAEHRAALYATICRAVFAIAEQEQEQENRAIGNAGQQNHEGGDLLTQVVAACQAGINSAMKTPSQALALAKGFEGALKTLTLVVDEIAKGDTGNAAILASADQITHDALHSVLRYAPDQKAAQASLASVTQVVSAHAVGNTHQPVASPPISSMPLFSEVAQAYSPDRRVQAGEVEGADCINCRWQRSPTASEGPER